MTTESKPQARRPAASTAPIRTRTHRSDEPYSSILEEDVDLTAELGPAAGRTRAPRISREEVYSTADALLVEGIRPTIDRVRVRLGRGSPNTINEFMDAWWAKLGSRLRDLPGREFPQLPERVAGSLHKLWNEALAAAHDVLQSTLIDRDQELSTRRKALEADQLALDRERLAQVARNTALEEALQLASKQLEEANQRARVLEQALGQRDGNLEHARAEIERLSEELQAARLRLETEQRSALEERARLQERSDANERRWLTELDRARQAVKATESATRELQAKVAKLGDERESARNHVQQLRGEVATATAVREQLEARLNAAEARGAGTNTKLRRKLAPKPRKSATRAKS